MNSYEWLEKRVSRSVDNLRLWSENPRLSPEERHVNISDFVADLIADNAEKDQFYRLIDSIAVDGFIPADPIVVWKSSENDKFYVAEGNRRVLVLKLLRNPEKAPKSIRLHIRSKAALIDRDTIEKIKVSVAPSYEYCLWYVHQRHASGNLHQGWSRLQQVRWVAGLFDQFDGDYEKVMAVTKQSKPQLDKILWILKIRDLALVPEIYNRLSKEQQDLISSHRIPITILERWFSNPKVKEQWGIDTIAGEVIINKNKQSFYNAYCQWLKLVIKRDELGIDVKINTRTIDTNLDIILGKLPNVIDEPDDELINLNNNLGKDLCDSDNSHPENCTIRQTNESKNSNKGVPKGKIPHYNNPDRPKLVVETCKLKTENFKLRAIFEEFKLIPMDRYKNCLASSLRVFLDLSVSDYLKRNELIDEIQVECKRNFNEVILKKRLEYIKKHKVESKTPAYKTVDSLLNPANDFSLDTLNGYVHGDKVHLVDKKFLNRFWDSLLPLISFLVEIEEV